MSPLNQRARGLYNDVNSNHRLEITTASPQDRPIDPVNMKNNYLFGDLFSNPPNYRIYCPGAAEQEPTSAFKQYIAIIHSSRIKAILIRKHWMTIQWGRDARPTSATLIIQMHIMRTRMGPFPNLLFMNEERFESSQQ